jgi:3-dehydroquinate dehydratase/shikimate dehydrogenase
MSLPHSRLIAVALGAKNTAEALGVLQKVAATADIAEIRLDLMDEFDLRRLLENRPGPVVVTYRPEREGGRYRGSEDERIAVLQEAIRLGAEYVDIEMDAVGRIGYRRQTKIIVSHHDFAKMPLDFLGQWRELKGADADVVKLVGMAREARDTLPVLETLAQADVPTIALAMGEAGLPTRVLSLKYASTLLTYCAPDDIRGTAPGQVTVSEMDAVYFGRRISPHTVIYGLLGPGVETGAIGDHNQALRGRGIDAVAVPMVVPEDGDAPDTVEAFRALDVRGYHIQPPHQETVGQALDGLESSACRKGKVNTVYRREDRLVGAWIETPVEQIELWAGSAGESPALPAREQT